MRQAARLTARPHRLPAGPLAESAARLVELALDLDALAHGTDGETAETMRAASRRVYAEAAALLVLSRRPS